MRIVSMLLPFYVCASWDDPRTVQHLTGRARLRNVSFVHVPRTGRTFVFTLFRGACRYSTQPIYDPRRMRKFISERCPHAFFDFEHLRMPLMVHMGNALDPNVQIVALLRKPWKRALSGLYHAFDDCPAMQISLPIPGPGTSSFYDHHLQPSHVLEYADCVSACHARIFTAARCGFRYKVSEHNASYVSRRARTEDELRLREAMSRLEQFTFVGITDHWDATLLLFSARFDVPPVAADRADLYHVYRKDQTWVKRILEKLNFLDDPLYDKALQAFATDIKELIAVMEPTIRLGPSLALRALTDVLRTQKLTSIRNSSWALPNDSTNSATPQVPTSHRFPGVRFLARYISGFLKLP